MKMKQHSITINSSDRKTIIVSLFDDTTEMSMSVKIFSDICYVNSTIYKSGKHIYMGLAIIHSTLLFRATYTQKRHIVDFAKNVFSMVEVAGELNRDLIQKMAKMAHIYVASLGNSIVNGHINNWFFVHNNPMPEDVIMESPTTRQFLESFKSKSGSVMELMSIEEVWNALKKCDEAFAMVSEHYYNNFKLIYPKLIRNGYDIHRDDFLQYLMMRDKYAMYRKVG